MDLPADYECSYCCDPIGAMKDPRKLPCDHVFCYQCLKNDLRAGLTIICPACGESHRDLDLDSLPEYNVVEPGAERGKAAELEGEDEEEDKWDPLPCSKPTCEDNSMGYCGDCKTLLCIKHKEIHDEWFDAHKYIPYDEYRSNPDKYDDPKCPSHGHVLILACERCDRIWCKECDLTPRCPKDGGQCKPISLIKIEKKFKEEYQTFMTNVSKRHTEFTTKSKEVMFKFEDLVVGYDEEGKTKMVEKVAAMQIAEIKRREAVKKCQITEFPKKMDEELSKYVNTLHESMDELKNVQNELGRLMRECHITEVIKENKTNRQRVAAALQLETGECDILREMVAAPTGLLRDIEIDLRPLFPRGMIKLNAGSISPSFISVTDRGDLLFVEDGTIKISGIHHKHVKHTSKAKNYYIRSLAQSKDRVYVASYQNQNLICHASDYNLDPQTHVQLCNIRCEDTYGMPTLVVTEDFVVIMDRASYSQSLQLYTHDGKNVKKISLPNKPTGILPHPGNGVIVKEQNYLTKYSISATGNAAQSWRTEYQGGTYMATDSAGVIYSTRNDQYRAFLTMFHPDTGEHVSELQTEESSISFLAIKDNMLACVDNRSKLSLYQLTY